MVGTIDKTALFKIALAVEILDHFGFFHFIHRLSSLFRNYDFLFQIEKRVTTPTEIPIDFVPGAKPFTIKGPDTETSGFGKWTIARINQTGLTLFPEKLGDNVSDSETQKEYKDNKITFIRFFSEFLSSLLDEAKGEIKTTKSEFPEQYKEIYYHYMSTDFNSLTGFFKYSLENSSKDSTASSPVYDALELHPSMFYLNNEYVAEYYHGGMWVDCIEARIDQTSTDPRDERDYTLFPYEDELSLLTTVLDNSKHALYIDARILFEGQPLVEPIIRLDWMPINLINMEQRGIYNGVYCPIGKSEFIAKLDVSLPIKEYLNRINSYIETRPLLEEKQGIAKHIVTKFQKAGYLDEERESIIAAFNKTFQEFLKEEKEHHGKTETGFIQVIDILNRWKQQQPAFSSELSEEHRNRYRDIIKRISELAIPISQENPGLYKNIITLFGTLAGNIIESIISPSKKIGVTPSNLADNPDITSILKKLQSSDYEEVKTFSRKQGKFFNDVKHNKDMTLSFKNFFSFIIETQAVLGLFVKNKHLFT